MSFDSFCLLFASFSDLRKSLERAQERRSSSGSSKMRSVAGSLGGAEARPHQDLMCEDMVREDMSFEDIAARGGYEGMAHAHDMNMNMRDRDT